jgi:non-ribosomal peptide synthetase component F
MNLTGGAMDAGSFRDVLAEVRTSILGAFANQDVPFNEIVNIAAPRRSRGENPLFQAWFDFDDPPAQLRLGNVTASPLELPARTARMDVALHVRHDGAAIRAEIIYRAKLVSRETVERIAQQFERIAVVVADASEARTPGAGKAY